MPEQFNQSNNQPAITEAFIDDLMAQPGLAQGIGRTPPPPSIPISPQSDQQPGFLSSQRGQFVRGLLTNFLFSFGQALQANATGGNPYAAGIQAPFQLDAIERQKRAQEQNLEFQTQQMRLNQAQSESTLASQAQSRAVERFGLGVSALGAQPGVFVPPTIQPGMIPLGHKPQALTALTPKPGERFYKEGSGPGGVPYSVTPDPPWLYEAGIGRGGVDDQPPGRYTPPSSAQFIPSHYEQQSLAVPELLQQILGKETVNVPSLGEQFMTGLAQRRMEGDIEAKVAGLVRKEEREAEAPFQDPIVLPAGSAFGEDTSTGRPTIIASFQNFESLAVASISRIPDSAGRMAAAQEFGALQREYNATDDPLDKEIKMLEIVARTRLHNAQADRDEKFAAMGLDPELVEMISKLRADFERTVDLKHHQEIATNVGVIFGAYGDPRLDFAMISATVKLVDPEGAVREGEVETVLQSISTKYGLLKGWFARARAGGSLTANGRKALLEFAMQKMTDERYAFDTAATQFTKHNIGSGIAQEAVIYNPYISVRQQPKSITETLTSQGFNNEPSPATPSVIVEPTATPSANVPPNVPATVGDPATSTIGDIPPALLNNLLFMGLNQP